MKYTIIIVAALLLASCSIEKRLYRPGFHVESHVFNKSAPKASKIDISSEVTVNNDNDLVLEVASMQPELNTTSLLAIPSDTTLCDTIIFYEGTRLIAKVESISRAEVKYRKCNNLQGPLYIEVTDYISSIRYSNGTREVFKEVQTPAFNVDSGVQPYTTNPLPGKTAVPEGEKQLEGFGFIGFLSLLLGAIVLNSDPDFAAIAGLASLIFAIISFSRFSSEGEKLTGRFFPIFILISTILGLLILIGSA
jgi:hypothetical protein